MDPCAFFQRLVVVSRNLINSNEDLLKKLQVIVNVQDGRNIQVSFV